MILTAKAERFYQVVRTTVVPLVFVVALSLAAYTFLLREPLTMTIHPQGPVYHY